MAANKLADMASWMAQNPASDAEIRSATFTAPARPRRSAEENRAQFEAKRSSMIQARLMKGIHWSPTPAFNAAGSTGSIVPLAKAGVNLPPQTDESGATWYPVAIDQSAIQPGDLDWLKAKIEAQQQQQQNPPAAIPPGKE